MKNIKKTLTGLATLVLMASQANAALLVNVYDTDQSVLNIAQAEQVIAGTRGNVVQYSEQANTVNFWDGNGVQGLFGSSNAFTGGAVDTFALTAEGQFYVDTAGIYTFGTNADDGIRLRINGTDVLTDDRRHPPETFLQTVELSQGWNALDFLFFEHSGGATVELFAAEGSFNAFDSNAFRLLGDTDNGGLETRLNVSEPSVFALLGLGLMLAARRRKA